MKSQFRGIYNGRTVLVTGHTGFKGSWLTLWLKELGANVVGYALEEPPTEPSNFILSNMSQHITDIRGDACHRGYGPSQRRNTPSVVGRRKRTSS